MFWLRNHCLIGSLCRVVLNAILKESYFFEQTCFFPRQVASVSLPMFNPANFFKHNSFVSFLIEFFSSSSSLSSSSSVIYFYFAFCSSSSCPPLGRDRGLWVVGGHTQIHITRILIPLSHTHTHTCTHTSTHSQFFLSLTQNLSLLFRSYLIFFCSSSCSSSVQILISRGKQTHFHINAQATTVLGAGVP